MPKGLDPERAKGLRATVRFDLLGDAGGRYYITLDDGRADVSEDVGPEPATVLSLPAEDYVAMAYGRTTGQELFLSGRMRVTGSIGLAMRLEGLFKALPDDTRERS